jgi:ribosomal-protein-alanine N-acetyltransferase
MSEALGAVISFGKKQLEAHRIQAEVVPENTVSLKLLEKFGFRQEGLFRQYLLHEATKMFLDVIMLSLINNI